MKTKEKKLKILQDALGIELNGIELYKMAAKNTADEQAKDFFIYLSNEEKEHFSILKKWYIDISTGKSPEVKLEEMKEPANKHIFSDEFKKNLKGKNFEFSVMQTGMLLEKNSMEFYHKQRKEAETDEERELFKTLEEWEAKHYQLLLKEYNDLKIEFWEKNNFSPF